MQGRAIPSVPGLMPPPSPIPPLCQAQSLPRGIRNLTAWATPPPHH